MSDLIAALADQIVALINASPHSPSKADIDGLIRDNVIRWDYVKQEIRSPLDPDINVHRPIAIVLRTNPALDQSKVEAYLAERACPGSTDGSHDWQRADYYIGERCPCGAIKP